MVSIEGLLINLEESSAYWRELLKVDEKFERITLEEVKRLPFERLELITVPGLTNPDIPIYDILKSFYGITYEWGSEVPPKRIYYDKKGKELSHSEIKKYVLDSLKKSFPPSIRVR